MQIDVYARQELGYPDLRKLCDKCGKPVLPSNDAVAIQRLSGCWPEQVDYLKSDHARHFLPEGDCEGSPSRAQYIEGQPRDQRGYPYFHEVEQAWREAYQKAQKPD